MTYLDWFEEFKKSYDSYPSQDNEGYIPDRAGFKTGFVSAWNAKQKEIGALKAERDHFKVEYEVANEAIHAARKAINTTTEDLVVDIEWLIEERDQLEAQLDILNNPSDGRCMNVASLRKRNSILQTQLTEAKEALGKISRFYVTTQNLIGGQATTGHAIEIARECLEKLK